MASYGATVAGTDGSDHVHREQIVRQYYVSAANKSRLKWTVVCHYLVGIVMIAKLLPEILDKLDIFVMEIERLFLPKPLLWEWAWLGSLLGGAAAVTACKKSKIFQMRLSQMALFLLGLVPAFAGLCVHFSQFYDYVSGTKGAKIDKWMGYPVAVLWYAVLAVAFQVHLLEIYVANTLIDAWRPKRKTA